MSEASGLCDLHCHLLFGLDDGAKTLEDSLAMARALVELGFTTVAPSPHNRPEYAARAVAEARLVEVRAALVAASIPLSLEPNAENFLFDEHLFGQLGTEHARKLGAGAYLLVEAPYTAPVPALPQMLFQMKLKGVTPLIAHPERCLEFERPGRAAEAVKAGARLQLDIGALIGRYGGTARKVARAILDAGLYSVGATDLHSPVGAVEWVGRALVELRERAGEREFLGLMRDRPRRMLAGEALES